MLLSSPIPLFYYFATPQNDFVSLCYDGWKNLQPRQIASESKNSCHAWNQLPNDETNVERRCHSHETVTMQMKDNLDWLLIALLNRSDNYTLSITVQIDHWSSGSYCCLFNTTVIDVSKKNCAFLHILLKTKLVLDIPIILRLLKRCFSLSTVCEIRVI